MNENFQNDKKFFYGIQERLKKVRKELKMTQKEFGESAGIDRRYVAKVECGSQNPSFTFMRSISCYHNISMNWLMYGQGNIFLEEKVKDKYYS